MNSNPLPSKYHYLDETFLTVCYLTAAEYLVDTGVRASRREMIRTVVPLPLSRLRGMHITSRPFLTRWVPVEHAEGSGIWPEFNLSIVCPGAHEPGGTHTHTHAHVQTQHTQACTYIHTLSHRHTPQGGIHSHYKVIF